MLALPFLGTTLASAAAVTILFCLFPPEAWQGLSLSDRLGEAGRISYTLGLNAILDGLHASLLNRLHRPDPFGALDFDGLRSAIGQRWTVVKVTAFVTATPILSLSWLLTP